MPLYNHAFDLAFEVVSREEDPLKVDARDILAGLQRRVDYLIAHPDEVLEACDCYDSMDEEQAGEPYPHVVGVDPSLAPTEEELSLLRHRGLPVQHMSRMGLLTVICELRKEQQDA
jgi:hypothetical protein